MDQLDLFRSCRSGNLERLKYLVEQKDIELNVRDKWDSTPLYYACLCGHAPVVKYLLENGAKCEANTFDGERCLYGALSQNIRNMLKNYHAVTAQGMRRDVYDEFLRRCYEGKEFADVTFVVHGIPYRAHRSILSARSEYFNDKLLNKWRHKPEVTLTNTLITSTAFNSMLEYLYTGRINHIDIEDVDDIVRLADNCKLDTLYTRIKERETRAGFFSRTKAGTRINQISVDLPMDSVDLNTDLSILAEQAMPAQLRSWVSGSELPFFPGEQAPFADVCFLVGGHRFMCHRLFFCLRSDYFRALLQDHFNEFDQASPSPQPTQHVGEGEREVEVGLPVICLSDVNVHVFIHIIYYVYTDTARLELESVFDVLYTADLYLLPGLKRQCANYISQYLDCGNVLGVFRAARLLNLPRLEDQCTAYIAKHLYKFVECREFHLLIQADAEEVRYREETDSIQLVDDLRYHISCSVQGPGCSGIQDAADHLTLLDRLLETLGLDA